MKVMTLDDTQKIVQICFWAVSGTVVVLTYLRARKGILSPVNAEYQKRVMDQLQKLSEQLYEEFDADSESHWSNSDNVKEVIGRMNERFLRDRETYLKQKEWWSGIPVTKQELKLMRTLEHVKSDPFIPKDVRELVMDFLENRFEVIHTVHMEQYHEYGNRLATGSASPANALQCHGIHNQINKELYSRGCGISQIRDEVHEIRRAIQRYFESFDPR